MTTAQGPDTSLGMTPWGILPSEVDWLKRLPCVLTEVYEEASVSLPLILRHSHDTGYVILLRTMLLLNNINKITEKSGADSFICDISPPPNTFSVVDTN